MPFISRGSAQFNWYSCAVVSLRVRAVIVYDMVMNVLDTKWLPQHNIVGLISGITFSVLFQSGEASTVEGNKHTHTHCVKRVRIRSYSGPHSPAFGLTTERYFAFLRIQSECRKMRTRITPNKFTFYASCSGWYLFLQDSFYLSFLKTSYQHCSTDILQYFYFTIFFFHSEDH